MCCICWRMFVAEDRIDGKPLLRWSTLKDYVYILVNTTSFKHIRFKIQACYIFNNIFLSSSFYGVCHSVTHACFPPWSHFSNTCNRPGLFCRGLIRPHSEQLAPSRQDCYASGDFCHSRVKYKHTKALAHTQTHTHAVAHTNTHTHTHRHTHASYGTHLHAEGQVVNYHTAVLSRPCAFCSVS